MFRPKPHHIAGAVLVLAALVVGAFLFTNRKTVSESDAAGGCGTERWAVKTLSDSRAHSVHFTALSTSVDTLRRKSRPYVTRYSARISGVETTTYRVSAKLVEAKREADSDIHLVIADPRDGRTMIVEFPKTTCVGSSFKRSTIGYARNRFLSLCGTPSASSFTHLHGRVTITGVGFFDMKHGQTGVAPNAIELHPVLGFSTSGCSR